MYSQLANRWSVASAVDAYTQAVTTSGNSVAQVDATVIAMGSGTVTFAVEGSNDLENWATTDITGSMSTTAVGYVTAKFSTIAYDHIRLKVSHSTGQAVILAAGVNTSKS